MQRDNATIFTAEIAPELMNTSLPPAHQRDTDQVETFLTIPRVYMMLDWDELMDGILDAFNSTRQATKSFSAYNLQHGAEKSIPFLIINPVFAVLTGSSNAHISHSEGNSCTCPQKYTTQKPTQGTVETKAKV